MAFANVIAVALVEQPGSSSPVFFYLPNQPAMRSDGKENAERKKEQGRACCPLSFCSSRKKVD
jgi:hypothetical protein